MFTFQANLSRSLRDTAVRLAELGWLHNKIRKYADQRSLDRSFGLVGQVCSSLLGLEYLITLRFESGLLFRTVSLVTDDAEKMQGRKRSEYGGHTVTQEKDNGSYGQGINNRSTGNC